MNIKQQGQILELDPTKEYWMFVKVGSFLAKTAKQKQITKRDGQILFVGDLNEFRFVENSNNIKGIILEES